MVDGKLVMVGNTGKTDSGDTGGKTSITSNSRGTGKTSITSNTGNSRGTSKTSITSNTGKTGITSNTNSRGNSSNRGGNMVGSITDMFNRLGNTDGYILNSVDWGVDRLDDSLSRVGLICSMVDMGSLNDLLDGVDLVRRSNWDGTWDSNIIRSSDMLVDCNDTLNRGWDMDRDINIVFLYVDLRDDVGGLRSDPCVSPDRGENLLLGNGVSRSISSWDRCWRDGSIRCWWSWDHWGRQSHSLNKVLGNTRGERYSRLSNVLNTTNSISMTSNNRLYSSLDNLVSNNSILNTALNLSRSSSIGLVGLSNNSWGRDHWGSSN